MLTQSLYPAFPGILLQLLLHSSSFISVKLVCHFPTVPWCLCREISFQGSKQPFQSAWMPYLYFKFCTKKKCCSHSYMQLICMYGNDHIMWHSKGFGDWLVFVCGKLLFMQYLFLEHKLCKIQLREPRTCSACDWAGREGATSLGCCYFFALTQLQADVPVLRHPLLLLPLRDLLETAKLDFKVSCFTTRRVSLLELRDRWTFYSGFKGRHSSFDRQQNIYSENSSAVVQILQLKTCSSWRPTPKRKS